MTDTVQTASFQPTKINLKSNSPADPVTLPITSSDYSKINLADFTLPSSTKQTDFEVQPIVDAVAPIVAPIISGVVSTAEQAVVNAAGPAGPIVQAVADAASNSFRLTKLPTHDDDFATDWLYATQKETVSQDIIDEYNAYLQAMDELQQGKIVLPEGFDGPTIANDIKTFVLQDFRKVDVTLSTKDNLAHRTFYCHCIKRAIDILKQGEYTGDDGYTKKKPEVADAITNRINQILFDKMLAN